MSIKQLLISKLYTFNQGLNGKCRNETNCWQPQENVQTKKKYSIILKKGMSLIMSIQLFITK